MTTTEGSLPGCTPAGPTEAVGKLHPPVPAGQTCAGRRTRYSGRDFSSEDIECIRQIIASDASLHRVAISRRVCAELGWHKQDGKPKEMSCRVALLRMQDHGLIRLPPPRRGHNNGKTTPRITSCSDPGVPIQVSAGRLTGLVFTQIRKGRESSLWNELIRRYHYLGYTPLPGAQMRYLVYNGDTLLAAMGFGASAWKPAPP